MYFRIEPVAAMQCLAHRPQLTLLDSSARHDSLGRYSYLACDPLSTYLVADGLAKTSREPLRVIRGKHFAAFSPKSARGSS
ncbi:hypothetical protein [Bradyrhizobium sp. cir1]|uniref:hypothetical protein n=1 Tax=Bradyrhizobium sp. cir1 TaxID=1445730 RepID=UPI00289CF330|nr:hypothetical protein [Bradyrhizobium sp. cir1]